MRIYKKKDLHNVLQWQWPQTNPIPTAALTNTRNRLYTYIIYVVYTHNGTVVFFLSDIVSSHQTPPYTEFSAPVPAGTNTMRVCVYTYIIFLHIQWHAYPVPSQRVRRMCSGSRSGTHFIGNIPRNVSQQTTRVYIHIHVYVHHNPDWFIGSSCGGGCGDSDPVRSGLGMVFVFSTNFVADAADAAATNHRDATPPHPYHIIIYNTTRTI